MSDIVFRLPAEIRFGLDMINRIGPIVSQYGERALLVTEAILYEGKTIERVQSLLDKRGIQHIVFDEVVPNATSAAVDAGVTLARGARAEVVIGLGGMRTLSTAKCIAMAAAQNVEMDDLLLGVPPRGQPLAYVEIPTTCRNPFMLVDEYLITDSRDRTARLGRTQANITRAAIIDPKLTATLPAKYTATTIMDTLLACVEGYLSGRGNFLSETFFLRAVGLIGQTVRQAVEQPEDIRARINASMAGLLCALGLNMSRQGLGAALAYALNARYLVPKSWLSCILLPHVMEFFLGSAAEKLARLLAALDEPAAVEEPAALEGGSGFGERGALGGRSAPGERSVSAERRELPPVEAAAQGIETLRGLIGSLGLPTRLRDFDLDLDDMIEVAGVARSFDMMNYLARPVSTEDLYELIKSAY